MGNCRLFLAAVRNSRRADSLAIRIDMGELSERLCRPLERWHHQKAIDISREIPLPIFVQFARTYRASQWGSVDSEAMA